MSLVLCYHAVSDRWPSTLAVRPGALRRQLTMLLDDGYRAVDFSTVVTEPAERKLLAVTFDDNFRSVIDHGFPILEQLGIPATMFVPVDFVGAERLSWPGIDHWLSGPFEHELAAGDWASLKRLAAAGWEIGSHTLTHPDLTRTSDDRLDHELARSRATIEAQLGRSCPSLAYPYGACDRRVIEAAGRAGYAFAATLPRQFDAPQALAWPRIGVYGTDGQRRFAAKVSRTGLAIRRTPVARAAVMASNAALRLSERVIK